MNRLISTFILGILLASPTLAQRERLKSGKRSSDMVVDLGYAKYAGVINDTSHNAYFLGIRYAAPPIETLRWRAPRLPAHNPGVQPADTQPPSCYKADTFGKAVANPFRNRTIQTGHVKRGSSDTPASSEDCLFLNIFTPGTNHLLPVLVFIHGGGYQTGSSAPFNGDYLVELSRKSLVVVTIQYRLGVFGFLPGTAVKEGGDLNVGLLDQHLALKWVRQHIRKFGGDPSKVTIWGESAGAGSVLQQVIAQDGNTHPPLFRGAITSSSFLPSQYKYNDAVPEALYNEVVSQAGCSSSSNSLECLRNTNSTMLQVLNSKISGDAFYGTYIFVPVVDGTFITQRPTIALRDKKVNGEMLLSFTNSHEGNIFVNQSTSDVTNYVTQLFPLFGEREIEAVVAEYSGLGLPADQANAIMGEAIFVCPTYYLMRAFPGRAFKGEFAIPPGLHEFDIPYYFPYVIDPSIIYFNKTFVDAFGEAFTDFILSLNPNIKTDSTNITPHWDRWNGRFEMLFNRTESGAALIKEFVTSPAVLRRCGLWERLGALSGQ